MTRLPILATIALLLALGGCTPTPTTQPLASLDQLASAALRKDHAISPAQLADRVMARREDHVLLDLRSAQAYTAGHIKGARNLELPLLFGPAGDASLPPAYDLIVYADDGGSSAQAAALLRVAGRNAYYLDGGYQGWRAHLHGEPAPTTAQEAAKRAAVACWFEGDYVAAAGLAVKSAPAPSAGYTPPLQPAAPPPAEDPLGLGLGLGLGPETAPAPSAGRLRVGEGC